MTHSIDLSSINELRVSAFQGQHSHVIEQSIVISQELLDLHQNVLDMRARSYVACAQFEKALETATIMQEMCPSSAHGYLCQGYIHMEQGRCTAACDVYNAALERVDKSDPSYDTIKTMKTMATQQVEKCKDFIGNLPMDIALVIIRQLLIYSYYDQQSEYIMVSSTWCDRFMESRHFQYTLSGNIRLDETNSRVIESLSHVRLLSFEYYQPSFFHLFEKHHFTLLTQLIIRGSKMKNHHQTILALKSIKGLTNLTLDYTISSMEDHHETRIRLQDILTTCPNLVSLDLHGDIDIPTINGTYPKLKELKLYQVMGTVDNQHVRMIHQHLPGLETLHLSIAGSSRPLTIDDTPMPAIRHLAYGNPPSCQHLIHFWEQPEYQGLTSFSITRTDDLFPLDHVASLIINHHATLQYLELKSDFDPSDMNATENQQHIQFKELKTLVVDSRLEGESMHAYHKFISWIIERSPNLYTVTLDGYTTNKDSLKSLVRCAHLHYLFLDAKSFPRPNDHDIILAEFFRDHVMFTNDQGGSRLQTIKLRLYQAHPILIDALGQLKSLVSLSLFTKDLAPESFTSMFAAVRQGCHSLVDVYIMNDGVVPNRVLYELSALPKLATLTIHGNMSEAQAGVVSIQRCRRLQSLACYWPIDDDIRSMLLESIPGLNIRVVDRSY
ncbi:hypothetical protein K492DRAFT_210895 [Lichtheimia hyalospora FSU 10163]|nr:hypothetical protein K492DRAFT_210895 [Lichtheimia hyalospora FSU 10163]